MKFLFDFFPVILFFIAYQIAGIYVATAVAIAASVLQIVWILARRRKVGNMQWVSLVIIVVFGGATLLSHDDTFIRWKPTVLYWIAGVSFLGALAFKINLVKGAIGEGVVLPEPVWLKLCVAWAVFFLCMGALNLWVAYNFSLDAWVNFKLFGGMGLMVAFVIAQAAWLSKYVEDEPAKADPPKP